MPQPRFAIVNSCDRPERHLIAEWVDEVGYCYMHDRGYLSGYDGMTPARPTAIEDFGFKVYVGSDDVLFEGGAPSTATYEDGKPRSWQDSRLTFKLPLVKDAKPKETP